MRIGTTHEVVEEVKPGLAEDAAADIFQGRYIELGQGLGNKQVVAEPEQIRCGYHKTGGIVEPNGCFVRTKDIDIVGESDVQSGDSQGDKAESVQPVPDPDGHGGQVDVFCLFHGQCFFLFLRVSRRNVPCPIGIIRPAAMISAPIMLRIVLRVAPIM